MPDTAQWVAIVIAALTGGFARDILTWTKTLFRPRSALRRTELETAWSRADEEARKRRIVEEHASHLRRALIEAPCVDRASIEPFPTYSKEK